MDVHEALTGRRTVHLFQSEPVPHEVLQRAYQAAVSAPNHKLTEPWRFREVTRAVRSKLVEVALELKAESKGGSTNDSKREKTLRKMLDPAALVVPSQVLDERPEVRKEDYAAVSCAIYGFMLSLWSAGFGTKWSTGAVTQARATYELLGVNSEEEEIVGFIWAGRPAQDEKKPRRRRPLHSVATSA